MYVHFIVKGFLLHKNPPVGAFFKTHILKTFFFLLNYERRRFLDFLPSQDQGALLASELAGQTRKKVFVSRCYLWQKIQNLASIIFPAVPKLGTRSVLTKSQGGSRGFAFGKRMDDQERKKKDRPCFDIKFMTRTFLLLVFPQTLFMKM